MFSNGWDMGMLNAGTEGCSQGIRWLLIFSLMVKSKQKWNMEYGGV